MNWWISKTERTLTEEVPAPPNEVRDYYVDLNNIKLVHPLIVSVEQTSRSQTPDGYRQSYRVVDQISVGSVHHSDQLPGTVDRARGRRRAHRGRSVPGVRLRGTVSFEPIEGGTRVTERIRFAVPRPLAAVTVREGVKAHIKMLSGIREHFQSLEKR